MKKSLILLFVLILLPAIIFAQQKWIVKDILIQAPAELSLTIDGDCPSESHDSNRTFRAAIAVGSYESTLTFDLDSLQHKLRNVISSSGYYTGGIGSTVQGYQTTSFQFSSLDFIISSDSILKVNTRGTALINNLSGVSFHIEGETYDCTTAPRGHWLTRVNLDHLLEDTSQYSCSITFILPKSISAVNSHTPVSQFLSALSSLYKSEIIFSFPSSDHSQQLMIYDILGREVSRIEIPMGSTSYELSSIGYPKGTYFARLGSLGAKFAVY